MNSGQRAVLPNKSVNSDPQLKAAASPLMLVVRLPLRYASRNSGVRNALSQAS
jgi:hypothetical protein